MANRDVGETMSTSGAARGVELLRVEGLTRRGTLKDVSFVLHAGEVVGIAGLLGAGRTELARAIFGADTIDAGTIRVRGEIKRINRREMPSDCALDSLLKIASFKASPLADHCETTSRWRYCPVSAASASCATAKNVVSPNAT
jgi:ABC-type uncharacterized transport system ATPase subunit